jgi:hypothetical protein
MSNVAKKSTETAALMYDHDFRKLRELDPVRWWGLNFMALGHLCAD